MASSSLFESEVEVSEIEGFAAAGGRVDVTFDTDITSLGVGVVDSFEVGGDLGIQSPTGASFVGNVLSLTGPTCNETSDQISYNGGPPKVNFVGAVNLAAFNLGIPFP